MSQQLPASVVAEPADPSFEGDRPLNLPQPFKLTPNELAEAFAAGKPLKEMLGVDDDALELLYAHGYRNYQMGRFNVAEHWWFHVCMFDCRRDRNWISLGMACQKQKKFESAMNAFSMAVNYGSTNPWAALHAAECHIQLKNDAMAAKALESASKWADQVDVAVRIRERVALLRRGIEKRAQR